MGDEPIANGDPDRHVLPIVPFPLCSSLESPHYAALDRLWARTTDWSAHPNCLRNRLTLAYPDRSSETIPFAGATSTIPFSGSTAEWRPKHGMYSYSNRAADLAAALPVELLDNILYYAGYQEKVRVLRIRRPFYGRPRWAETPKGSLAYSRVCLRWANKCRQYFFSGATLRVSSCEKAETLIHYALHGCPSLIPLHTLISEIDVRQTYEMPYSFLHRISLLKSVTGKRLEFFELDLSGPIPDDFPSCKRDTPHWSIPSFIPTPPSILSYTTIFLRKIHLPSFTHAAKYISHFQSATETWIEYLTWDDDRAGSSIQAIDVRRGNLYKMRNEEFYLSISDCTDTARLFLHALIANIRSPLYVISDDPQVDERSAMVGVLRAFSRALSRALSYNNSGWPVSDASMSIIYPRESLAEGELMVMIDLRLDKWEPYFILEDGEPKKSLAPDLELHVVGFIDYPPEHLEIREFDPMLDDLMPCLQQFPMLHAIAIIFRSYEELSLAMSPYRPSPFHPLIPNHKYILVIDRYEVKDFTEVVPLPPEDHADYIGIHPITLIPTGQVWKKWDDIIPSLLAIPGP